MDNKQIKCTVKELFTAILDVDSSSIEYNDFYNLKENRVNIKDENNEWVNIKAIVLKKDKIAHIKTNKDNVLKAAYSHKICINKETKECKYVVDLNVGDKISSLYEESKIKSIEKTEITKDVYDFEIASKSHLYATSNGLIHHNSAGIGKTHVITKTLQGENKKYKYISGGIKNARALYQILHDNNDKNLILVFDDVNEILRNKQAIEVLRTAVTNDPVRHITYTDNKIAKGSRKYKPEIEFKSKIIIITNIPVKKIDKAIVSRTTPIEVIVTPQEVMDNIRINIDQAPPSELETTKKMDVWDFLTDDIGIKRINKIDYRIFEQLCIFRATDSPKWKKFGYAYVS